jgi:hypothetical protein
MGAGCYYTHPCNRELAAWIEIRDEEDEDAYSVAYDFLIDDIKGVLAEIGYEDMRNGLAKVELESTYYGDGLIIQLYPRMERYESSYQLFLANFDRMQRKIWRALQKAGYALRIATSGYTSAELLPV